MVEEGSFSHFFLLEHAIRVTKRDRLAQTIEGRRTECIAMGFLNRIFVIVTQKEDMGCMMMARKDPSEGPIQDELYTVRSLIGNDFEHDPFPGLLARRLIESISKHTKRPLLLSVAMHDRAPKPSSLREIVKIISEKCRVW